MKTIKTYNFQNKRALVRVDFNVPLDDNYNITDDTRMQAALPTLKKILADKGSLVIMSHLGRPKNGPEEKFSLKHLVKHLSDLLNKKVIFIDDCIGEKAEKVTKNLQAGEVVLLENLRFYKQETAGSESFAKALANHGDVYVNDAFGTAHRAHASTAVVAKYFPNDKMFGYLIEKEIESVNKVIENGEKPVVAIIGGAKVSGKIRIIKNLLNKIDCLMIGGGMVYTFIKAKGGRIGNSLVEEDCLNVALEILAEAEKKGVRVLLPEDTIAADTFNNEANKQSCLTNNIPEGWMGMDIGTKAIESYTTCIEQAKTILWNGPMGVFEMDNFEEGTKKVAYAVVTATEQGAFSLIGGGDSVAAVNKYKLAKHVSHVSTGGGAMLEYLEGKELPGIHAIMD